MEDPHYPDCVTNALRFIEQHLSVSLTVEQVSTAVFASPHTLAHKFKSEMGVPLGQYVDGLVLFKAEQLLLESDLPLSTISESLGFCDQFYFSRRFRERFGVPPLQYRKQHQ